jgi:hypothetical protein
MVPLLLGDFIGGASKRPRSEDYFIPNLPGLQICNLPWPFSLRPNSKTFPLNTRFLVSQKTVSPK